MIDNIEEETNAQKSKYFDCKIFMINFLNDLDLEKFHTKLHFVKI